MKSCCVAQGNISSPLRWNMIEDNVRKITLVRPKDKRPKKKKKDKIEIEKL